MVAINTNTNMNMNTGTSASHHQDNDSTNPLANSAWWRSSSMPTKSDEVTLRKSRRSNQNNNNNNKDTEIRQDQGSLILQDGVLVFVEPASPRQGTRGHEYQYNYNNTNNNNNNYNSNNNDDNNDNDNDASRPQGDDDNFFDEVDCSRFEGWDDPPPECAAQLEYGDQIESGYDENYDDDNYNEDIYATQEPETDDGGGVTSGGEDGQESQENIDDGVMTADPGVATGLTTATIVPTLEEESDDDAEEDLSPDNLVTVQISIGMAKDPSNFDYINQIVSQVVTEQMDALTPFYVIYLGNLDPPGMEQVNNRRLSTGIQTLTQQQKQQQRRRTSHVNNTNNEIDNEDSDSDSDGNITRRPPVDLLHAWTIMEPILTESSSSSSSIFWYWTRIEYAAFISTQDQDGNISRRPIRKRENIGNITLACQSTINRTIANGILVHQLEHTIEETLNNATDANKTWLQDQLALLGVAPFGITGQGEPSYIVGPDGNDRPPYTEQLDLEFGIREWFGLSLAIATVLVSTLLFLGGAYLQRRQTQKLWSTAVMTEQGISDILQVGWRYQAASQPHGTQLFLQIFEKPPLRNDDDSLLQGGMEKEELARTGGLAVYDEGSREDDSSSSNRQPSTRTSTDATAKTQSSHCR